jgi:hypothetical protein
LELPERLPGGVEPLPIVGRRPVAVTFVGVLALAVGIYHVVDGATDLSRGGDRSELIGAGIELGLGLVAIVIALGALRVRRWAWAAFMTWAAVGLTHQLIRHFFFEDANYLSMALDTVAVFALTPLDVQIAFRVRPPRNVQLDRPTRNPIDLG